MKWSLHSGTFDCRNHRSMLLSTFNIYNMSTMVALDTNVGLKYKSLSRKSFESSNLLTKYEFWKKFDKLVCWNTINFGQMRTVTIIPKKNSQKWPQSYSDFSRNAWKIFHQMTVKIIPLSLLPDMWCLKFLFLDTQSLPALFLWILSQNPEGKPSRVLPATPSEISSEIHSATPAEISTIFPPPILPGIRPNISSALFKGSSYKFLQETL